MKFEVFEFDLHQCRAARSINNLRKNYTEDLL